MFLVRPGKEDMPPAQELRFGSLEKQKNKAVLQDFLHYQIKIKKEAQQQVQNSDTEKSLRRAVQLRKEIEDIEAVLTRAAVQE